MVHERRCLRGQSLRLNVSSQGPISRLCAKYFLNTERSVKFGKRHIGAECRLHEAKFWSKHFREEHFCVELVIVWFELGWAQNKEIWPWFRC